MVPYTYHRLEADEIRLFELLSGDPDSVLQGSLHRFRLPEDAEPIQGHKVFLTREDGFDVPNAPEYEALSYTWGAVSKSRHDLQVLEGNKSFQLPIRPNLDTALRRIRMDIPMDGSRFVWIDAVCINQCDLAEKNAQIPKMAMIYNRASGVCVWLGPEDQTSGKAIEFIDSLLNLDDFDPLTKDPGTPAEWAALLNLMQRPWFNRRWIVQEISLARHATLLCGPSSVSWLEFSAAVALFASRYQDLRRLFQSSAEFQYHPNYLGEVGALGAKLLVDLTSNLFRKSDEGTVLERMLSLEGLITSMTAFEASSPHDTVYAVLWLAHDAQPDVHGTSAMSEDQLIETPKDSPQLDPIHSDDDLSDASGSLRVEDAEPRHIKYRTPYPGSRPHSLETLEASAPANGPPRVGTWLRPPLPGLPTSFTGRSASERSLRHAEKHFEDYPDSIIVDYSKSVYDVLKDFLEFTVTRSRIIDILCYPWAPEPPNGEPNLPSWICRLSNSPFDRKPRRNTYSRVLADPLVGSPGQGFRNYNASGRTRTYPGKGFVSGREFCVAGFVIDAIGDNKSPAFEGIIPSTWLDLVDWAGPPDLVPEELWRTMVADRGLDGRKYPPAYFPLACKWMFEQRTRRGSVNTSELLTSGQCPSIASEFIHRVQSVVWGRKLIRTEGRRGSKQLLGLVPAEAEQGDLICILYGCSVPVVLRKLKSSRSLSREDSAASVPRIEIVTTPPGVNSSTISSSSSADITKTILPEASPPARAAREPLIGLGNPNNQDKMTGGDAPVESGSLLLPEEPLSLTHVSSGVRRALERDRDDKRPPNLVASQGYGYQYKLVGECYIHGMMDGEAFKHRREHGNKLRMYYLV